MSFCFFLLRCIISLSNFALLKNQSAFMAKAIAAQKQIEPSQPFGFSSRPIRSAYLLSKWLSSPCAPGDARTLEGATRRRRRPSRKWGSRKLRCYRRSGARLRAKLLKAASLQNGRGKWGKRITWISWLIFQGSVEPDGWVLRVIKKPLAVSADD